MMREAVGTMVRIPGGTFRMGSERFYPDERPVRSEHVESFLIDVYEVTNEAFRRFVEETGYVTVAERPLDPDQYPGAPSAALVPGAMVFHQTAGPVANLDDWTQWWRYVPHAQWRYPQGPGSAIEGKETHPVVQIAYEDAQAYATWAGKALPTEAEWEFAARGGLEDAVFSWGDEMFPGGKIMANTWLGDFPWHNVLGSPGTRAVGSFPPNGYGLYDMAGNVWEWTSDWYRSASAVGRPGEHQCCGPIHARSAMEDSYDPTQPSISIPRRVLKGGSFLCAPNYCLRFRPSARSPQMVDTAMSHLGFRCVAR
jgi:formylglycine-generating enzyme required for sulfatase activity